MFIKVYQLNDIAVFMHGYYLPCTQRVYHDDVIMLRISPINLKKNKLMRFAHYSK